MAQDYKDQGPIIQGKNQLVREYVGNLQTNTDVLRSNFSGSSAPTSPTVGQLWFNTLDEKFYKFTSSGWNEIDINTALFNEVKQSRGLLSNLHTRLDVALNPDGTLKNPVAAEIDEWKENAIAITVLSDNSFSCSGDLTPIFTKNRAVKVIYSDMSFKYSYVKTSEYSDSFGITSVTIKDDYINADTTAIYYALIQHSIPFINESLDNINDSKADKLENGHGIVRSVNNQYADDNGNVNLDGFQVGDTKWTSANLTQVGWLVANGASVRRDTYPDLCSLYETMGFPWGTVDDEHFNLPNLMGRFPEGSESAGGYKEAGLPNIEGRFVNSSLLADFTVFYSDGAITARRTGTGKSTPVTGGAGDLSLIFDASQSSPIYGKSSTVQPPSVLLTPYIKAFAGASASSTDLEITKVAQDVSDKANRDLNNLSEQGRKAFFPSDTFIRVSPNWQHNPSGYEASIVAPANGWYSVQTISSAANTSHSVWARNVNNHSLGVFSVTSPNQSMGGLWQVSKGQLITLGITSNQGGTDTYFIYAEGEV